jgi:hypothetical protein
MQMDRLDREIHGPEWGTLLGPSHLAILSVAELERSGVFARVRKLSDDVVFLQLTENPLDALDPGFAETLDRAREVLRPILMDVNRY